MKKTFLKAGALALISLATLTGCGGGGDPGVTTVKFSVRNYAVELEGWKKTVSKANELLEADNQKVRIEIETIQVGSSWDDFYNKVRTNILTNKGGTIGRIAESHMPKMRTGKLIGEVTELANELKATGEYNNSAFEGVAKEGDKYYGLPSGLQHMVLYYNKDKFDAYNQGKPAANQLAYPSANWEDASVFQEIRTSALKLTSGEGLSKQFGFSAGPFLAYAGMYSKNSGGYNIFDDEGKCKIYSQSFLDVYNWLGDMIYTDKSSPNISDSLDEGGLDKFCTGNVAMYVGGVYDLHDIVTKTKNKFTVGVGAIPVGLNADGEKYSSYTSNFTDCYWASDKSRHKEEDRIALRYLMKSEVIKESAKYHVGGVPIKNDCVDNYFNELKLAGLSQAAVDCIRAGAAKKINVPYTAYYNEVDLAINAKVGLWMNHEDPDWYTDKFVKFAHDTMVAAMPEE